MKNAHCVNIGFIGGSITVANGWRPKITDWIKCRYKLDSVYTYNAAIGGTNSKYGVFRIDRQLLNKADFDLIFVEFAVNDGSGLSSDIEKSMEGIVRKIWKNNPYTDICFVYTASTESLADCGNGKMNLSVTKQDSIASYYGIPSVFWTQKVYNMLETDTIVWHDNITEPGKDQNSEGQYVFTKDNVHPTNFGHEVYTAVLANSLVQMENSSYQVPHQLKSAIYPDNYENASMLSFNKLNNQGFSVIDSKGELEYLDEFISDNRSFLVSSDTLSEYHFSFFGSELGLNLIIGPTGGNFIIEIDSSKKTLQSFDGYCSYYRRSSVFIKTNTVGEHFVKIYPSSRELTLSDKKIILNSDRRKKDLKKHPSKYDKNELIFSDIFLDGWLTGVNSDCEH